MRAVVLNNDDKLSIEIIAEPNPGPGEVIVRVAYAGIQWGDVLVSQGHFPVPRPFTPGFEAAGTIVAVGEDVSQDRVGESVAALTQSGAFAEFVAVNSALAIGIGEANLRTAAGFGWVTPTAYALVNEVGRLRPNETILIHAAAGGVGSLAAQFASVAGASKIVGVVLDEGQRSYTKGFPYDSVVLAEELPEALDEQEFDVILDPIGGDTRVANMGRLAPHARLVVYGNISTFAPVRAEINDLLMRGTSVLTYNSNLLSQTHPEVLSETASRAWTHLGSGDVNIDITVEYALEDLDLALDSLAAGRTHGKSIVRVA